MAIKSRPVYSGFDVNQSGERHLIALAGEGAKALLEKVAAGHPMLSRAELLYTPDGSSHAAALEGLGPADFWQAPSIATLVNRLDTVLATATMSTRLYVAGTEPFIGTVVRMAAGHGVKNDSISKEHRGSLHRQVQCVHCKGTTDKVTTSPFECVHCGLLLFVRDHFSRRLNAFQGVCVNAEEPSVVPPTEELYA